MPHSTYILQRLKFPASSYTGQTSIDPHSRLGQHNSANGSTYTKSRRPWRLVATIAGFATKADAMAFERLWKRRSRGGLIAHLRTAWSMARDTDGLVLTSYFDYTEDLYYHSVVEFTESSSFYYISFSIF